jgi:hypothetical protein
MLVGFQEVVDYCLQAEGITLDDVDLAVQLLASCRWRSWKSA